MTMASDASERVLLHCFWEITEACNLRCIHCEVDAGVRARDELSTDQALSLCDALAKAGCRHVVLTGGEPLVRPDWFLIAEQVSSSGMTPTLITNGILVNDATVSKMIESGIQSVSVSIDGREAVHDRIRLGPNGKRMNSYRRAIRALALLSQAGIKTAVITQIHKGNIDDLPRLHDEVAMLGIDTWQVQICMPLGRLMRFNHDYLIDPSEVPKLISCLTALIQQRRVNIAVGDNIGYFTKEEPILRGSNRKHYGFWTGCKAGILAVAVCANGDVKGCPSHPRSFVVGNITQTPFGEIWQDEQNFEYNTHFQEELLQDECAACEYRRLCRAGCTTMAYAVTGTIYNNPFCARQTRAGSREQTE
jgi:radical SAM protein with 4Fe4S-binding SPASM domain